MNFKKYLALGTALTLTLLAGCGSSGSGDDQIVIYSNADEEAVTAMENALDLSLIHIYYRRKLYK